MFNNTDIDDLNEKIAQWNKDDMQDIQNEMRNLGIKHSRHSPNKVPLKKAFTSALNKRSGLYNRIKFSIPKSAIYLHKGVSKSHPITNPRRAKQWFNPVVERNIESLAEIVADGSGTLVVNALKIK